MPNQPPEHLATHKRNHDDAFPQPETPSKRARVVASAKHLGINAYHYTGELINYASHQLSIWSLKLFQALGGDIVTPDINGDTLLHVAAKHGKVAIAQWLLDNGADVNAKSRYGDTPLHVAAQYGQVAIVQWLLINGANVDAEDGLGTTQHGQDGDEIAQWLLAVANAPARLGKTPLHVAAQYGRVEIAQWLLQSGANMHAPARLGKTPLHVAVQYGQLKMAQRLLQSGANVHAVDRLGTTPLHVAVYIGQCETARVLLENGADVNVPNYNGNTPLHVAAHIGQFEISRWLVKHHANIYSQNNQQRTPEQVAREGSKTAIFLIEQYRLQIDIAARVRCYSALQTQPVDQNKASLQGLPPEILDKIISHLPIMRQPVNSEQKQLNRLAINDRTGLYFDKIAKRNSEVIPENNENLNVLQP